MRVTAYTAYDHGMNGHGITASGGQAVEGRTVAAPRGIPMGTRIYIPALGRTYWVEDRGSAIKGDRLDIYIEHRKDALEFGVRELEVWVKRD
jgi:3D (Asp-Asp-Asp) domain-containing protein